MAPRVVELDAACRPSRVQALASWVPHKSPRRRLLPCYPCIACMFVLTCTLCGSVLRLSWNTAPGAARAGRWRLLGQGCARCAGRAQALRLRYTRMAHCSSCVDRYSMQHLCVGATCINCLPPGPHSFRRAPYLGPGRDGVPSSPSVPPLRIDIFGEVAHAP
eukprot:366395-Chlamydomonas_euryale.AAC.13